MKKYIYLAFTGALTLTALSACNWQIGRYAQSCRKWELINAQISQDAPADFPSLSPEECYSLKYVQIEGQLNK